MKNNDSKHYEIALIGYTGAGKTVLAAGLYATSTEDFTVSARDGDTADCLQKSKACLDRGGWPDTTNSFTDLHIENKRRGKEPIVFDFKEYMGERAVAADFNHDIIGNPRGALILLNPKMDILRDSGRRNEMIMRIKSIIDYLAEPGMRCSHIAFVVTASDLLTTSLKDYKDEFDGYKREITNSLNTNPKFQNAWKEFEVTVTGPLDDQEHPRLAKSSENTARLPFEWLVEQFEKIEEEASRRERGILAWRRKVCIAVFSLLLLLGFVSGFAFWYFYLDRAAVRELESSVETHCTALNQAVIAKNLLEIGKHCGAMEAVLLAVSTNKSFFGGVTVFDDNKADRSMAWTNLVRLVEKGRSTWFSEKISGLGRRIDGECAKVSEKSLVDEKNDFGDEWKTLQIDACKVCSLVTVSGSNELDRIVKTARPQIYAKLLKVDRHNKEVKNGEMAQHDIDAETQATKEMCEQWRASIADWNPATDEGLSMRSNLLARVDGVNGKENEWRKKYERKQFVKTANGLLGTLQNLIVSLSFDEGATINKTLRQCNEYAAWAQSADAKPEVDWGVRQSWWGKIRDAKRELLEKLRRKIVEGLKPDRQEPPKVSDAVRESVQEALRLNQALSREEFADWKNELTGEVQKVYEEWEENQNTKCADFIKTKVAGVSGVENVVNAVGKYKTFCSVECPQAPDLGKVAEAVSSIVTNEFRKIYEETKAYAGFGQAMLANADEQAKNRWQEAMMSRYKKMEDTHNALKRLVDVIAGRGMRNVALKHIEKTVAYAFASECLKKMPGEFDKSFEQEYEIRRIDAMPCDKSRIGYKEVRNKISRVDYDRKGKTFSDALLIECTPLTHDDKDKTNTIWRAGNTPVVVKGTPWFPAMFVFDSVGGWFDSKRGRTHTIIPLVNGSDFEDGRGYVDASFKMNNDVTVYVRVYVRSSSVNFLSLAEHYLNHGGMR